MNKEQRYLVILIGVIVLLAAAFGVYAFTHKGNKVCKDEETDAVKFKREYEEYNGKKYDNTDIQYFEVKLESKNLFKYIKAEDAVKFLKDGTGVIYFGFPRCPWCRTIVPYLEEIGKSYGIKEIYYLNILDMRDSYKVENGKVVVEKDGTKEYYEILDVLDKYLTKFTVTDEKEKKYDTGVKRLYAPTTVIVKEGKIVGFLEGTVDTQKKFVPLTEEEDKELRTVLSDMFSQISPTVCTETSC